MLINMLSFITYYSLFQNRFTYEWCFLSNEDTVANTKVSHKVRLTLCIKLDLEVAATMLFCCLVVFRRDHKIIHNMFLLTVNF